MLHGLRNDSVLHASPHSSFTSHQQLIRYLHSRANRLAALAAKAAGPHQQQQQQSEHAQALSTVLLLNENIRRQLDRPLLQRDQLLSGVELMDAAQYACIVLGSSSSSSSSSSAEAPAGSCSLLYANQAARDVLLLLQACSPKQQQQQQVQGVPAEIRELLGALPSHPQQQQQQQQQQQHTQSCVVLQDVSWLQSEFTTPAAQQQQQQLHIPTLLVVPLMSPNDAAFGLALLFDSWRWGGDDDAALGVPGWPRVLRGDVPDELQLQAAADAVRHQADAVRGLKTQQGLGNKDPKVVAAVSELQALKQQLARLDGLQQAFAADRHGTLDELIRAVKEKQQEKQQRAQVEQ